MRRIHLFELEDFDWVPRAVRDGGTDFLDLAFDRMGFYSGVAPRLAAVLDATGSRSIVDLCSGGGGGARQTWRTVRDREGLSLLMTDKHPSEAGLARVRAMSDPRVSYATESVDAMRGGGDRAGVRTMSGALHHFMPDAVRELLAGIVARREPLVFFDVAASAALRRTPIVFLPIAMALNMLALFVAALLLAPLARPFSVARLVLTYVVPAIPMLVAWDGTVSALRAYTPQELLDIARSVPGSDGYTFEAGVEGRALFLTGVPTGSGAERTG